LLSVAFLNACQMEQAEQLLIRHWSLHAAISDADFLACTYNQTP